jgi:DMSO/TMAO reductase YedYZ molybdopterin-dependent catalytic subunit
MSLFSSKTSKDFPSINQYGQPKLPSGQLHTEKFPVLTYGPVQHISLDDWQFEITGLVNEKRVWTWEEFMQLPQTTLNADFHCVTHWSRFDDDWTGVLFRDFWETIKDNVKPEAEYVVQHAYGGYTTNLPLQWMLDEDVMLAHTFNGEPLPAEHGGPMRVFTPKRYAWKGAKWIKGLEFLAQDKPGFWEQNGYSNSADPWKEERYWE